MTTVTGTVVARYKRHCLVADSADERVACQLSSRALKPVVGDTVVWRRASDNTGTVIEILDRRSMLTRIDGRGRPEVVAANLTQLIVVVADDPMPDWFLVDRYLAAAQLNGLDAVIVYNKIDLASRLPDELDTYAALGYALCRTSTLRRSGLEELVDQMRGHRSVMIGQSGVGKSSLLNALIGDTRQVVGALSQKSGQGKHTTSTAVLCALPAGVELVDSPGVRDFAPYIDDVRSVAAGFREFHLLSATCRFPDCGHIAEPECAIKAAVAERSISERRYTSYVRLYELTKAMRAKTY